MAAPYSQGFHVIATLTPAPGKIDRSIELLQKLADHLTSVNSETIRYVIARGFARDFATGTIESNPDQEQIFMSEIYVSKEAFDAHMTSEFMTEILQIVGQEELLLAAPDIKAIRVVGGYDNVKSA